MEVLDIKNRGAEARKVGLHNPVTPSTADTPDWPPHLPDSRGHMGDKRSATPGLGEPHLDGDFTVGNERDQTVAAQHATAQHTKETPEPQGEGRFNELPEHTRWTKGQNSFEL